MASEPKLVAAYVDRVYLSHLNDRMWVAIKVLTDGDIVMEPYKTFQEARSRVQQWEDAEGVWR
jgi:hypothetical protein